MLESKPQIVLQYVADKKIVGQLEIFNSHSVDLISFKVKTTNLTLFIVYPTKGYLDKKGKIVEISLVPKCSLEDVRQIVMKEKFMIQYIFIKGKLKQQDLESQWQEAKANKSILKHKVKLNVISKSENQKVRKSDISLQSGDRGDNVKQESRQTQQKEKITEQSVQGVMLVNETQIKPQQNISKTASVSQQERNRSYLKFPFVVVIVMLLLGLLKSMLLKQPQIVVVNSAQEQEQQYTKISINEQTMTETET